MANQQEKNAIRRLKQDLEELQLSPVENVSATPLETDMFEWHCNFQADGVVYHMILFFPKDYPYTSPSAEFVPPGYRFSGGANMPGKKGVKVCLSIFNDFANIHTEWAKEKGVGWSPAYTVQTVLMNMVSYIMEHGGNAHNADLAKKFACKDCGHTQKVPFPEMVYKPPKTTLKKMNSRAIDIYGNEITDYISKATFDPKSVPQGRDDLFGFGLVLSGWGIKSLSSPCEFLKGSSFFGMKAATGGVQSMMKEELKYFLPLYINDKHGKAIKDEFENTLKQVAKDFPDLSENDSFETMIMKLIPNLMTTTIVEFSKGTKHTSDSYLNGFFLLHRLMLWTLETYPKLQKEIDSKLEGFLNDETMRNKQNCKNFGEMLMLLTASKTFTWQKMHDAFLVESYRRNAMYYIKDDHKLGNLAMSMAERVKTTFAITKQARLMLPFQVSFLSLAMPDALSLKQIRERYDVTMGFPTPVMVDEMKAAVKSIHAVQSYPDWFKAIKVKPISDQELFKVFVSAVEFTLDNPSYQISRGNKGGWTQVQAKYADRIKAGKDNAPAKGNAPAAPKGRGRGKAAVEKEAAAPPSKERGRGKAAQAVEAPAPGGRGRGRGKAAEPAAEVEEPGKKAGKKGAGRGTKRKVADEEEEAPAPAKKARAPPARQASVKKAPVKEAPAKKGRGRGAAAAKDLPPAKGKGKTASGRGRGRGKK